MKDFYFYLQRTPNTFDLQLYGVGHMVKDHSDSDDTYHSLCYTSRGALAGTRNSSKSEGRKENVYRLDFMKGVYRIL